MHATLLALLLLLPSAACSSSKSTKTSDTPESAETPKSAKAPKSDGKALSAAKQKELKEAVAAFAEVPAEMRATMAAAALAEIESERLPKSLVETLESITEVSPDMRSMMISRGLADSILQVQTMCEGNAIEMMRTAAEQAPETRLALIRDTCKTDRFNLVANPGPNTDALGYLIAHVVLSHLQENGGATEDEKALIRYLASAQTEPSP
jgi:hypothetical protein